ncbi:MAG: hypothetical protein WA858_27120 [Xanthobacteraceae bacterium]|jgi:hypothetical protein
MIVIARSDRDEAIHFPRAQLAGNSSFTSVTTRLQPKLRASGLEGGASAQLKNGLLRFARNDDKVDGITN